MKRKSMVMLLSGVICLLGITSALAVTEYNEAPMLRTKVAAGELPPVAERLPEEPLVIPVVEKIGQYGGQINLAASVSTSWNTEGWLFIHWECLLRVAPDGATILPNLATDWKLSDDAKSVTLYLRKGVKWSDGVPFTADDRLFWWEDYIMNDELSPTKPGRWTPGGEPMEMEKIDDYTIRLDFAEAYPLVALELVREQIFNRLAKHHMKQFHPRYTSTEELEKMIKEGGFENWVQLFKSKMSAYFGPSKAAGVDFPTIQSHVLVQIKGQSFLAERNPYYWKVDPAGNQLPYIDRILTVAGIQAETITAKAVAGELDFNGMVTFLADYPLYQENAKAGDYRVLLWPSTKGNQMSILLNMTYQKDLVLRDLFRDLRFRKALSLAIDRQDINNTLYFGKAVPRQTTVNPSSKYYEEEFAKLYTEYDPEQANQLLDEIGLKWDADHQWRLRPDGEKLTILCEWYPAQEAPVGVIGEIIIKHWEEIGVELISKPIEGNLWYARSGANDTQMGAVPAAWVADMIFPNYPAMHVPIQPANEGAWGPLWCVWYQSGGKEGEEPPEEVKKNIERYEGMKATLDEEVRTGLAKEILRSNAENLWTIGTVGEAPVPIVVRNNLRNVPETINFGWATYHMSIAYAEQFFLEPPLLDSQKG